MVPAGEGVRRRCVKVRETLPSGRAFQEEKSLSLGLFVLVGGAFIGPWQKLDKS